MASALVTGVAGFIGSHLAETLLDNGYVVRGMDNFDTGNRERLDSCFEHDKFEFMEGDIRDPQTVQAAVEGIDCVFHQAAIASVPRSFENPERTTETNCQGTTNVLVASRDEGVSSVVVASSAAVYGSDVENPVSEDDPVSPESPYALSKYWTEQLASQFCNYYDLETVGLRYFNVYGPGQDPQGDYAAVIPNFVHSMVNGRQPTIYGDGEQTRDFVYVKDVVDANLRAALGPGNGEIFNVATGNQVSINQLVDTLNEILGTSIAPEYADPRPGDIRHSFADISKIGEKLNFQPSVDLSEGLEDMVSTVSE